MTDMKFLDDGLALLLKPSRKQRDPFYDKARSLAKKLGIQISIEKNREYGNGYWIETDLLADDRFQTDWEMVYHQLQLIDKNKIVRS